MTKVSHAVSSLPRLPPLLRVPPGTKVDVTAVDSRATPSFTGDKKDGAAALAELAQVLSQLQERLYAQSRVGGSPRAVLPVVQGMDTSGKGGILRHVIGQVDPQGVAIRSFKAPTAEELEHDSSGGSVARCPPPV